ncbi:hypothetical protein ANSO36C_44510 [Nostoc cf. commune SO-36]|uniref:Uncharacterized protein n=1 Tax=Nostoc cf. commune SO-36 TaxID=449208 RepID=A0ABN6Q9Y4_NOSCO|nr:hypothetical protein [Nostoc commune]BDI18649.1 hypothetical protein ANSO36C_44510 [Nostoc cf. commune SO-36]
MDALTINFAPVIQITDEQFFQLCQINELIRFEPNADSMSQQLKFARDAIAPESKIFLRDALKYKDAKVPLHLCVSA